MSKESDDLLAEIMAADRAERDAATVAPPRQITPQGLELEVAATQPPPDVDFDFGTMVENIPESGGKYIDDTLAIFTDPEQVITGMAKLISGAGQKIDKDFADAISVLATGTPTDPANEEMLGILADQMKNKYGTVNGFKQALMDDPVSMMADMSMVATMGLTAPLTGARYAAKTSGQAGKLVKALEATRNVASKADPFNAAMSLATNKTLPKIMEVVPDIPVISKIIPDANTARNLYREGLGVKPTQAGTRAQKAADAIGDYGYDMGVRPTRGGVETLRKRADDLELNIDDIISNMPERIPLDEVYSPLRRAKAKRSRVTGSGTPERDVVAMEKVMTQHRAAANKLAREGTIKPSQLQKAKKQVYKTAAEGGAYGDKTLLSPEVDAYKNIGLGAKEALEQRAPDLKGLNAEWGTNMDLQNVIHAQGGGGSHQLGMDYPLARVAGASGIPAGGANMIGVLADFARRGKLEAGLVLKMMGDTGMTWQMTREGLRNAGVAAEDLAVLDGTLSDEQAMERM